MKKSKSVLTMLFATATLIVGAHQAFAAKGSPACYGSYDTPWYEQIALDCTASWQGAQAQANGAARSQCYPARVCGGTFEWSPFCEYSNGLYRSCTRLTNFSCTLIE